MATNCMECGKPLVGRIDKKFCNDQCRFQYNNKKKRVHEAAILNINQQLRKNRTIIKSLNPVGKTTVRRSLLKNMGFSFEFFTHIYRTEKGLTYYFNYDYGYTLIEDEKIVLVTYQRYMDINIYNLLKKQKF
jgi:predicted nucleic acid-binding Zn ribbon protein